MVNPVFKKLLTTANDSKNTVKLIKYSTTEPKNNESIFNQNYAQEQKTAKNTYNKMTSLLNYEKNTLVRKPNEQTYVNKQTTTGTETSKTATEKPAYIKILEKIKALKTTIEKRKAGTEVPKADNSAEEATGETTTLPSDLVAKIDGKNGAGFCAKVEEISKKINCNPQDLIGLMQSESGLNPSIVNSIGATGLIQFLPSTAKSLGTSTSELKNMSAIDQLDYVEKFFENWINTHNINGKKLSAGDLYTLCFLPAYINKDVLCQNGGKYYSANKGLDINKDGKITKEDLSKRVQKCYSDALSC